MHVRIVKTVILCFTVIWIASILLGYWHHNPGYKGTTRHFQYYDLWLVIAFLTAGSWLLIRHWIKKKRQPLLLNGLGLILAFILFDVLIVVLYYSKALPGQLSFIGLLNQLGYVLSMGLLTLTILWSSFELGAYPMTWFTEEIRPNERPILQLAVGIMTLSFGLFLLGVFQLLRPTILIPLLVTFLGLNHKKSLCSLQQFLLSPISINPNINPIGISCLLILTLLVSLNYMQALWISPTGYDSMTLYVKLAGLIDDHQGLVAGHQPYYWTLFMATGLTAFGRIEVVLALSMAGGVLTLAAFYHLSRRWLDLNFSLLAVTLFYSVPLVHFQSALDPKTDLGLLFYLVCLLLLFCNRLDTYESKKQAVKLSSNAVIAWLQQEKLLALIGLFAGFAIGIKMTAILALFALVIALWYAKAKDLGFLGAAASSVFVILLLRLDDVQLLRQYHLSADGMKWMLLLISFLILGLLAHRNLPQFKKLIMQTSLLALFVLIPLTPWLIKNYAETSSFSVTALLNGQTASPKLDIDQVERNWRQTYENQE